MVVVTLAALAIALAPYLDEPTADPTWRPFPRIRD
jgi:hypothetical protein